MFDWKPNQGGCIDSRLSGDVVRSRLHIKSNHVNLHTKILQYSRLIVYVGLSNEMKKITSIYPYDYDSGWCLD